MIRELDRRAIGEAHEFDDSFVVDSELAISAQGGVVRYEIVPVPRYEKRYPRTDLTGYLDAPDKAVFLAYLGGSVAGRVAVSEGWNRYAWIDDIAVDSRRRRAGLGRALIDRALDWAAGRALAGLRAETQSNNVLACRFYESCGFSLAGFDRDLYRGLGQRTTEVALFWYQHFPAAPPAIHAPSGKAVTGKRVDGG